MTEEPVTAAMLAAADQQFASLNAQLNALVGRAHSYLAVESALDVAGKIVYAMRLEATLSYAAALLGTAIVRLAQQNRYGRPPMTGVSPATSAPSTTRDVLLRAVALLDEYGWRQHRAGRPGGPGLGITGALAAAVAGRRVDILDGREDLELYQRARQACLAELRRDHLEWDIWLAPWNDRPGRTVEDVKALLRAAAARAEARA